MNTKKKEATFVVSFPGIGRGGGTRTHDPLHPMQVRYQAAPHPERDELYHKIFIKENF